VPTSKGGERGGEGREKGEGREREGRGRAPPFVIPGYVPERCTCFLSLEELTSPAIKYIVSCIYE